jgi:arsenate reductase (thioredoxin)
MAAAFFNQLADRTNAEAVSAGTEPGLRVHPQVLAVMQEIGIDLQRRHTTKAEPRNLQMTPACSSPWDAATNALRSWPSPG